MSLTVTGNDTTALKHTLKSSRLDWMLSDEDSRFRESWKERGESRHRLCCLLTLWERIKITLSFEILCYGLCNVFYVILYVTFITLFLCVKIFRYYIVYVYIWRIIRNKITLLFNILYCILCCFFFFFILFLYSITNVYIYIFLYYSFDRILNFKNRYVIYVFNFDLYSCEYRWRISKIYNKCIISYTSYVPCWFHLTLNGIMVILRSNMRYTYTYTYTWLSNISF